MDDISRITEATKRLSYHQRSILQLLHDSDLHLSNELLDRQHTVRSLQDRDLIATNDDWISLSELGRDIVRYWQQQAERANYEVSARRSSTESSDSRKKLLEKSSDFLSLYKQGLSHQEIADEVRLSRGRVGKIIKVNPELNQYLSERQETKESAKQQRKKQIEENIYSKSLAIIYPERVAELWDYKRNESLKPEEVTVSTKQYSVWFTCSKGHSWNQQPRAICASWKKGSSGCPKCAGKTKKAEKQPLLIDVYPELVRQYWDYEKNAEISLSPDKLTLSSNKKAWFTCPHDGNQWQSVIYAMTAQQWSKGKGGCLLCNGTADHKRGERKRRNSIANEFPDWVDKYWFYEANELLDLDPTILTSGSGKEAFFKCPVNGCEWTAKISVITRYYWSKGTSGCPDCRQ